VLDREEMAILCQSVHYDQNNRATMGHRKAFNKIHGNISSCLLRYRKRLQQSWILVEFMVSLLIDITLLHKRINMLFHALPIKQLLESLMCSLDP
jgi:hypothetical protein